MLKKRTKKPLDKSSDRPRTTAYVSSGQLKTYRISKHHSKDLNNSIRGLWKQTLNNYLNRKISLGDFNIEDFSLSAVCSNKFFALATLKRWEKILEESFLLEKEKDYRFFLNCTEFCYMESNIHVFYFPSCRLSGPCSRYAYWGMINGQAENTLDSLREALPVGNKLV